MRSLATIRILVLSCEYIFFNYTPHARFVKDLRKTFTSEETPTHALAGVSLTINKGEFIAIIGPSGSGKSTLLQILGLLDRPSGGTYFFNGKDVETYSDDEQAKLRNSAIGFVFQSFNLLARTSVLENVLLPLAYAGARRAESTAKAIKQIEAVGLGHRLNHEPSQLSGGEKQRVAIARALINDPDIIFADEPTGNLDSVSGENVVNILRKLHDEDGHTVVLITHDERIACMAERIVALQDGKIVSDCTTKEFLQTNP
jgi:putative ABC transport system ATP-binding protein